MIDEAAFANATLRAFGGLVADRGYRVAGSEGYCVRLENSQAFVEVACDAHRSSEVSICVGNYSDVERPLELGDVLRATDCDPRLITQLMTTDAAALLRLLERAAELLTVHGHCFLDGDPAAFAAAHQDRSMRVAEYDWEWENHVTLAEADGAWQNKDYARVYEFLSPLRDSLKSRERRRLDFAAKRL